MNEKAIRNYILCFIAGLLLSTGILFFFVIRPSGQRASQLRTELRAATDYNRQLEESVRSRQASLNRASDILTSSDDSISKLRAIIKLLREAN